MIKRVNLVYKIDKYLFNFQQYETIKSFAKNLLLVKLLQIIKDQFDLLNDFKDFDKGTRPKKYGEKKLRRDTVEIQALYEENSLKKWFVML